MMTSLSLWEYLRVIWRAKYMILALVLVTSGAAWVIGARQPRAYVAVSTILAPRDAASQGMSSAFSALLGGGRDGGGGGGLSFPGLSVNVPGIATNIEVYNTILMSRSMREEVVSGFARTHGSDVGRRILSVGTSHAKERTYLSVIVYATEAQLAADVANAYFDYLDRRLQRAAELQAKRQEVFYRAQLERAAREVDVAEDELLKFQQQNRMLANVDPSAKAGAEAGGSLRGAIMALEMQREVLRMRYTDQHPQMREIEKQIAEMKKQYSKNLFGQAMDLPPEGPGGKSRKEYFVPVERMTPVQFAYLKLLRNLKIQEAFYTGALQGLEQMRYASEAGRPQGIEMLDPAIVPSTHVRPNIGFIVLAAAVSALVAGCVLALVREYVVQALAARRAANPPAPPARRKPRNGAANGAGNGAGVHHGSLPASRPTEPIA
jgi:uncharacterized protein involved in exopolysaccharide biosynthesis